MPELEKQLDVYKRMIDIARDLASTLDLDILLDRIAQAAADITEAEAASIILYDDAARELYFQVATNIDEPTLRGLAVPLEGSIAGWIVVNRKPVRISDVHNDPRHFATIEETTRYKTQSLLGVPLITKDKVIGVLEVLNKNTGEFNDIDENLLSVLGAQAAVAIENARLFQQSDLIAEFVHELRTPLASIGTSTYLLLRPEISLEQREQMIRNIYSETLRLNTLASSFLDLARLESGRVQFRIEKVDLKPLLIECQQVMQSKADESLVSIALDVADSFSQVPVDREKMRQVVLNLLSNAIKYNVTNGKVIISARKNKKEWTLAVKDTGLGIPADAMPNLFQKFFRVRGTEKSIPGTGLGLSICKQIVSGHGGSIEVQSKLGEGTTFTLHMPIT
ncbi:MAG: ATP-binding protein [Chloroflexota bacterium]